MNLLDTDTVVSHFRGNPTLSRKILEGLTEIALPAIVVAELEYGARISANPENNLKLLNEFIRTVNVIPFDRLSAARYGAVKARLKSSGNIPGEVDILIAATAISHDAVLVTHNTKHFDRIEGLKLEDWF